MRYTAELLTNAHGDFKPTVTVKQGGGCRLCFYGNRGFSPKRYFKL